MLHLLCETIEHYVLLAGATLLLIAEEHNGRAALGGLVLKDALLQCLRDPQRSHYDRF